MLDENKIAFGKIMGVLLSINNKLCDDCDKVPEYVIKGLTHGFEPVIDEILGSGIYNLTTNDFKGMCNLLEKCDVDNINGIYDIDKSGTYKTENWMCALSLLYDKGKFHSIIDKVLKSNIPYLGKNKLSVIDEPLFNISNNNLNKV